MFSMMLFTAVVSLVFTGFTQDCYSNWANAFDSALGQYESGLDTCAGRMFPELCNREVEAAYNQDVNAAGDAHYCCVMGC